MHRPSSSVKRALAMGIMTVGAGVLTQGLHSAPVQAQVVTKDCTAASNPIYVSGSSAVKPFMAALTPLLAALNPPLTLVFDGSGSCVGVDGLLNGTKVSAAKYLVSPTTDQDCDMPPGGATADIGASDVFPASCSGFENVPLGDVADFSGPIQNMTLVVPIGSSRTAISAEAAYLTFGLGVDGETNWDNPAMYAVRDATSGTQSMIGKAIGVPPDRFQGVNMGNSQGVATAIGQPLGGIEKRIGLLSALEADTPQNRTSIRTLAYQHYGQSCAFWPDSSVSAHDKQNVRDGHYVIWGPIHLLAKVDAQGVPVSPAAKKMIDIFTLKDADVPAKQVIDLAIDNYLVPTCAMRVTRSREIGPIQAFTPDKSCGCYFDSRLKTGGTDCRPCPGGDGDCRPDAPHCNYGFCEVQ